MTLFTETKVSSHEMIQKLNENIPVHRLVMAEEIANAVLFVSSS